MGPVVKYKGDNIACGRQSLGMLPRNFRSCGRQRTPLVYRQRRPVYGLLLALSYKGSEWGSKLGCLDSDIQHVGEKVWGCGLGVFNLVGCNGPCQHVGLGRPNGPTRCTPVALGFTGSERESKLGHVAKNGENIAGGRQSLGMRPRNLRSYGRQRALSACRPARHVWGLLCVPSLLWLIRGQKGAQSGAL